MHVTRTVRTFVTNGRRGAILVLAAVLMVVVFAFVAFTVDSGYMTLVKTQLQGAADASALGSTSEIANGPAAVRDVARQIAANNTVAGSPVILAPENVELGVWDLNSRTFLVDEARANAVRVTARVTDERFFFAPVIGHRNFSMQGKAIAMLNPRDIVFVVDLSGSMNDDTEPCWATGVIDARFGPQGFPNVATRLLEDVYQDFGFGACPGTLQYVGSGLAGVPQNQYAYAEMTRDDGPLTNASLAAKYRIANTDSEAVRKQKAYRWIIDNQIASTMPDAKPAADSSANYAYWAAYLDYIMQPASVGSNPPSTSPPPSGGGGGSGGSGSSGGGTTSPPPPKPPIGFLEPARPTKQMALGVNDAQALASIADPLSIGTLIATSAAGAVTYGLPRNGSTAKVSLPPSQDGDRIDSFNNPNVFTFPGTSTSLPRAYRSQIGYRTYVQFMMDWGRDRSPDVSNSSNAAAGAGTKTPLSAASPYCPRHNESTAGGTFSFPPREQPMHSARRALIAAIKVVKDMNGQIAPGAGDRVAIVSFDAIDAYHAPRIVMPLTSDFDAAMAACTNLQAVSDIGTSTAMENGLILGKTHLLAPDQGGQGRSFATKVLVMLTDGVPNVWQSSSADISTYMSNNPNGDYYDPAFPWMNAALMQADLVHSKHNMLFPVGIGLGTDYDFMDRMSRMSGTAANGQSPRGSGNPAEYEQRLTEIFTEIIKKAGSRLVQ
jgi:Flp pilus assembly protein TadG